MDWIIQQLNIYNVGRRNLLMGKLGAFLNVYHKSET